MVEIIPGSKAEYQRISDYLIDIETDKHDFSCTPPVAGNQLDTGRFYINDSQMSIDWSDFDEQFPQADHFDA